MGSFWMVRAGSGGELSEAFLKRGCVAVGFGANTDLAKFKDKESIKNYISVHHPDISDAKLNSWAGSLHRFKNEIKDGDQVIFYDPSTREYHVGQVTGPCAYQPGFATDIAQIRPVVWKHAVSRDKLTTSARNALGSLLTVFQPGEDVRDEFTRLLEGKSSPTSSSSTAVVTPEEREPLADLREEFVEKSHEFIKDRILKLDWEEMQELVAAILRALGYRTRISPRGSDRGKDIIASPDGLGLSSPRIKAEVKHRPNSQISAPEVRSFIGGLRGDDRGLYISTGGFTTEATYEAERAAIPVTLLTLDDLASLVVQHYETMDADGKALIPLLRMYWPAS